ncbi:hypothetical protein ABFY54_01710 [Priestia megaterium]|uniref:hypothetical protein n=1 Tax=Priestia megaterium TaxID=1404 RepID=UPI003D287895
MTNGYFRITSEGGFLEPLKKPNRVKLLDIVFEQGGVYDWNIEVHKQLTDRIGVYSIEDTAGDIIYIGEANGVGGLKRRHATHEKKELFRLFGAAKLTTYHLVDPNKDDPGKVSLLERILIYGNEPVLNDDVKQSKPTAYFIAEEMEKQLKEIVIYYGKLKKLVVGDKQAEFFFERFTQLSAELDQLYNATRTLDDSVKTLKEEIREEEKLINKLKKELNAQKNMKENEGDLGEKEEDLKQKKENLKQKKKDLKSEKKEFYKMFTELNQYTKKEDIVREVNDGYSVPSMMRQVLKQLGDPNIYKKI